MTNWWKETYWPGFKKTPESNPIVAKCPQCNLEIRQVMHYACMQADCPTGLGGPRC